MSFFCNKVIEQTQNIYHSYDQTKLVIVTTAFNQGIQHLGDLAIQFLLKDTFLLSPAASGVLLSYVTLPWYVIHQFTTVRMIKPLWGSLTDSIPFFGSRRKSYILACSLVNSICWLLIIKYGMNNLVICLLLKTIIEFCICFCNVIGEAMIVEYTRKKQLQGDGTQTEAEEKKAASLGVSLFFGARALGFLVSAYFSGALLEILSIAQIFQICAFLPLLTFVAAALYKESANIPHRATIWETFGDFWQFFQNPAIYQPVLFIFCFMMTPRSESIMFYFYVNVLQFSPSILGQLRMAYAIATIAAVIIFNKYLQGLRFKTIFLTTTVAFFFCYESLIILVTRKNVEWGINDKIFCVGDQLVLQLVGEINTMPILVLACRMCPKNIEATMYAMIMSANNLGEMVGTQLGSFLLVLMGIDQNDFSMLWLFILVCGLCILIPLPWLYVVKEKQIQRLVNID